ncbi:hypothetical protein [Fulvivirga sp.]|uniref:hypothetical protein n=1 Tax=Fulvivirga sp. TaxID=1931237 RepID=UPI0032ED8D9B
MEPLKVLAISHVMAGVVSLITGPMAMTTKKGGQVHRKAGKVYFYAMTYVFITAVVLSSIKFIPFLFMISFLSYYGCFSGVRILKLKKLHKDQKPKPYDWFAGIFTVVAGLSFGGYGIYLLTVGQEDVLGWLSVFFGVFTINAGIGGLKLFMKRPTNAFYWYMYHIDGMMGSYIAAATAFAVTMGRMTAFNHWILWVAPAILGVPLISYWKRLYRMKFASS